MVEKNPYETNEPVDVPEFMNGEKKDDIDMSVFDLNEEEEEEVKVRKPLKKTTLLNIIVGAICLLLVLILIILLISKNNAYKSLESTYKTYQTTTETKLSKQQTEIENLTKENETCKLEKEKLIEAQSAVVTGQTTGEKDDGTLTVGSYVMGAVYVRQEPDVSAAKIDRSTVAKEIREITNDNGTLVDGTTVKVLEISPKGGNASTVWGKIADGCWICLRNNGTAYYNK